MTIVILIISLAVILGGCEGFTNGIEWFGKKHGLGEGAVGSVLAAVGTALPETLIPFVAIVISGGEHSEDIGVGAILGAPFMLATLAMFVTGAALIVFHFTRGRPLNPKVNTGIIGRDLLFFIPFYSFAILAGILHIAAIKWITAACLFIGYSIYVYLTLRAEGDLEGHTRPLYIAGSHPPHLPRLRWIAIQIFLSLSAIIGGAYMFVGAVNDLALTLGFSALVVSMLITPIATELPEKFNSVLWIRGNKDTLAMGNITGAMVFQSTFPVTIGLLLTDWKLDTISITSALFALGAASLMLLWTRIRKTIAWWMLLLGGAWYSVFLVLALKYAI
jgi:cation:H+ antiporter